MKDEKYMSIAIKMFTNLQKKYELKLVEKGNILNYSNKFCSFSVYFEKHFEFYICFHLNHKDLRLYDIAMWLEFEDHSIVLLKKNQIASEQDAQFVLGNLYAVLENVLERIQKKPALLSAFLEAQKQKKRNLEIEANLLPIRQAWKARQFEKFLMLVDSNRDLIKQSKEAVIILKQESYLKKLRDKGARGNSTD